MKTEYELLTAPYMNDLMTNLKGFCAINSERDPSTMDAENPCGKGVTAALKFFEELARKEKDIYQESIDRICSLSDSHLKTTDSIYLSKFLLLDSIIHDTISNKNILLQIDGFAKVDSLMLEHERVIALKQQNDMLENHLKTIDASYTNITIWGAVLSILFIVFSFFSIYKIEDTKKQMEGLFHEIKEKRVQMETEFNSWKDSKNQEYISDINSLKNIYANELESLFKDTKEKMELLGKSSAENLNKQVSLVENTKIEFDSIKADIEADNSERTELISQMESLKEEVNIRINFLNKKFPDLVSPSKETEVQKEVNDSQEKLSTETDANVERAITEEAYKPSES